jgi:hypothetical protein
MSRGPVNKKNIAIESYYGYMNIHLDLLKIAILNKQENEILFQKSQLKKVRTALLKLGYFERGK